MIIMNSNMNVPISQVVVPRAEASTSEKAAPREDIMSVLMTFEKGGGSSSQKAVNTLNNDSDSDMEDPDEVRVPESATYDRPQGSPDGNSFFPLQLLSSQLYQFI